MEEAANNPVRATLAPFVAVLAATVVTFAFDLGVSFARGWSPGPGYIALCAGLALGAAVVLGAALGWTRRPEIALAVWVGLHIPLAAVLYVSHGWLSAVGFAAVSWAALLPNDRRTDSPASAGIAAGLAVCLCAVILPRVFGVVGLERPQGALYQATAMATVGGTLLAHALYSRFRRRIRWLPGETGLSLAVLVAGVVVVPLALTGAPTKQTVELGLSSETEPGHAGAAPPPVVIVLVLDTVRADHLALYGYERDTTPALRAFVERHDRAVVYPLAFSPASWTLPAHASLFTGLVPSEHGAHSGSLLDLRHSLAPDSQLQAEATLAEVMKSRGYRTAAILANAQVMFFNGMERGFDQVVRPPAGGWLALTGEKLRMRLTPWSYAHALKPYPDSSVISREVLRFLDDCGPAPCFVLANYMDAHWPFAARPPYQGTFTRGEWPGVEANRYDEELLGLDAALGELLAELERRGVLERAWLVITADHGEQFEQTGAEHGTSVYNAQVRIPLIVHPPRGESVAEHPHAVGLLDVTATLSAAVGATLLGAGRDLRNPGEASPVQIEWYGEPFLPPAHRKSGRAVVLGHSKLIESEGTRELYQLDSDPLEKSDLASQAPDQVRALAESLPAMTSAQAGAASDERELPVDEVERLRALGYAD